MTVFFWLGRNNITYALNSATELFIINQRYMDQRTMTMKVAGKRNRIYQKRILGDLVITDRQSDEKSPFQIFYRITPDSSMYP